jgi:hypothetical protein
MASKICLVELMGSASEKRRSIIEVSSFKELVQNLREMHGILGDGPASRLPFYVVVNPIPAAVLSAPADDDPKTKAGILSKGNFSQLVLSNTEEVVELRCLPLEQAAEAPPRDAATVDEEKAAGPRKAAAGARNAGSSSTSGARSAPVGPINPSALAAALRGCTPSPRAPQPTTAQTGPTPTLTSSSSNVVTPKPSAQDQRRTDTTVSSTRTADRAQRELPAQPEPRLGAPVVPQQPAVAQRTEQQPALASWSSREAAKPTSVPSRPTSAATSKTQPPVASSSPLVAAPGRLPIDFDSPKPSRKKAALTEQDNSAGGGQEEEMQKAATPSQEATTSSAPPAAPVVNPREAELEAFRRRKEAAAAPPSVAPNDPPASATSARVTSPGLEAYEKNPEQELSAQSRPAPVSTNSPAPSKKIVVAESFPSPAPDVQSGTFIRAGKATSVSVERPSEEGEYRAQPAERVPPQSSDGVVAEILPIPVTQVRSAQSIIDLRLWALSQLNDRIVARYGPRPFLSGSMRIRTQVKFTPYPGAAAEMGRELDVDDDEDFARIRAMTPVPQLEAVWRGELGAESNITASSISSSSIAEAGAGTVVQGSDSFVDSSSSGPRKAANRRPVASRLDFDDTRYAAAPPPVKAANSASNQSTSFYSDPHTASEMAYPVASEPAQRSSNSSWQWTVSDVPQPQYARSSSAGTRQAAEPALPPVGPFVAPLRHSAEREGALHDSVQRQSHDRSRTPDFRPNGAVTPHVRGSDGLNVVKVESAETGAVAIVPFAVDRPPSLWSLRRQVSLQLTGSAEAALKLVTVFPASDHRLADRISDKGFQLQSDSDVILFSDGLRQAHMVGGPVPFLEAYPPNC